jgi:hypothetical protein
MAARIASLHISGAIMRATAMHPTIYLTGTAKREEQTGTSAIGYKANPAERDLYLGEWRSL